jgi:hypothetical protein
VLGPQVFDGASCAWKVAVVGPEMGPDHAEQDGGRGVETRGAGGDVVGIVSRFADQRESAEMTSPPARVAIPVQTG